MRHSLRITVVLLAAGLVVLADGCGGGSKSSAPPTTQATTTQQAVTTTSLGSFASAKNCLAFAGLAAKIARTSALTYGTPATAPEAASRELQTLADAAPSDIKGDLQTIATAFSGYLQVLQNSGYKLGSTTPPTATQIAALVHAAKVFNTSKLTHAEQHLRAWEGTNCK